MHRLFVLSAAVFMLAAPAWAETIKAGVNGLVCSFCATGIEKIFRREEAVEQVKVDLENKLVTVTTKTGQTLDDAKVTKLITDAGYTVTGITREK